MESKDVSELIKPNGYDTEGKEFISALPKSIKRRIQALKKLQVEGSCIFLCISSLIYIYLAFT